MSRITASRLDLAFHCIHWTTLEFEDKPGRAAVLGTAFHELASLGHHTQELTEEEEALTQKRYQGWLKHGVRFTDDRGETEVAYAFTPEGEVVLLGQHIDRRYDEYAGPDDICCTIDVVGADRVIDYKTGKAYVGAKDSWQLRTGAICAGVSAGEFHYVSETGRVKLDRAEWTSGEQHADRELLMDLAIRKRDGKTEPVYGEYCDRLYCPARAVCSRYREIMGELVSEPPKDSQKRKEANMAKMSLENIEKGRRKTPYYMVLYGPEGIGKSTFAAGAPNPIFLGEPGGTDHLDVARFPAPESWPEVLDAVTMLGQGKHGYGSLVIDTADYLEPLIWDYLCAEHKKKSIEAFGYGKGYVFALDEWRKLCRYLDRLRETKSMHVIMLAHSQLKTVHNPMGEDYEHYELKLHGKASALLKEWPKAVLFANYETYTIKDDRERVRAVGDGSRVVYTEHRPAYDAKNRYGLPPEIPLSWDDFVQHAEMGEPGNATKLITDIEKLIEEAPEDIREKSLEYLKKNKGDSVKLVQFRDRLRAKIHQAAA